MYEDEWKVEPHSYTYRFRDDVPRHHLKSPTMRNAWINLLKWYSFYSNRLPVANWEYHVRKACEGLGLCVVSPGFAKKIKEFIGNDDESERKKTLFCNFEDAVVLDVTNRSFKRFGGDVDKLPSAEKTHEFLFLEEDHSFRGKGAYVHYRYRLDGMIPYCPSWRPLGSFDLFLIRLNEKWLLVVGGIQDSSVFVYVSSDVPTVCLNVCSGVYADNEETDECERRCVGTSLSRYMKPFALVTERLITDWIISQANDCDLKKPDVKGKEKKCTCHKILREEIKSKLSGDFPRVVLRCKDGKVTHAWFDGKLSNVDMSYINNKPSNANVKRSYLSCTRLDIARIAKKMYKRERFKLERKLAAPRTEDLSDVFTSEY